jgi:nucleotide-binding universal stress UspA family protein
MDAQPDRVRARGRRGQSGRVSRPILVGYDVTAPNRRPLEFGIGAARCAGASRIVVCVYATPTPADRLGSSQEDEDLVADAARAIEDVEHVLPTVNLTIECRAVDGTNVARGLHEAATSARARLLVAGSTRLRVRSGLPGSLVGRIMHGMPCPVAVVPRDWESRRECTAIGVGYTDGAEGIEALHRAHALARRVRATLRVVTAVTAGAVSVPGVNAAPHGYLDALGSEVTVETTVVSGDPADVLVAASRRVDLLICGSRGYGARGVVSLSGVPRRVALEAYCPVVVLSRVSGPAPQVIAPEPTNAAERGYF